MNATAELARLKRFTVGDVYDRLQEDSSRGAIRWALSELADFGYLEMNEKTNGYANEYSLKGEPDETVVQLSKLDARRRRGVRTQSLRDSLYVVSPEVTGRATPSGPQIIDTTLVPSPQGGADETDTLAG